MEGIEENKPVLLIKYDLNTMLYNRYGPERKEWVNKVILDTVDSERDSMEIWQIWLTTLYTHRRFEDSTSFL